MKSKSIVNCCVRYHQYFEKFFFFFFWGVSLGLWGPPRIYHRFMYKAHTGDHSLLTLNLPFKVILRRFEVVFLHVCLV